MFKQLLSLCITIVFYINHHSIIYPPGYPKNIMF
jgi:hypothetical protein